MTHEAAVRHSVKRLYARIKATQLFSLTAWRELVSASCADWRFVAPLKAGHFPSLCAGWDDLRYLSSYQPATRPNQIKWNTHVCTGPLSLNMSNLSCVQHMLWLGHICSATWLNTDCSAFLRCVFLNSCAYVTAWTSLLPTHTWTVDGAGSSSSLLVAAGIS